MIIILLLAIVMTILVYSAIDDIPDFVNNPPKEKEPNSEVNRTPKERAN